MERLRFASSKSSISGSNDRVGERLPGAIAIDDDVVNLSRVGQREVAEEIRSAAFRFRVALAGRLTSSLSAIFLLIIPELQE